jgi:DNA-dependent RNA polymerase auxiliary subunit epsilon
MSTDEYRREELIRDIEYRVEHMTLRQLEALQYELETKDYSAEDAV